MKISEHYTSKSVARSHEEDADPVRFESVRDTVVRAVAEQLFRDRGGNSVLNWLEGEMVVDHLSLDEHATTSSQSDAPNRSIQPQQENPTRPRSNVMKRHKNSPTAEKSHPKHRNGDNKQTDYDRPTHDQICARAYEIWESNGSPDGSDMECWCRAEEELRSRFAHESASS